MGYHVATEVWYNYQRWWWDIQELEYQICDGTGEDPACFGTDFWPDRIAIIDHHLQYLDTEFGCGSSTAAHMSNNEFIDGLYGGDTETNFYSVAWTVYPQLVIMCIVLLILSCLSNFYLCASKISNVLRGIKDDEIDYDN